MNDFDEARVATEAMFANEEQTPIEEVLVEDEAENPAEQPEEVAEDVEEVPTEPTQEDVVLNDAVNTAEIAAQAAQQKEMQLQQMMQELEALKAQNAQMVGTIEELSKKNEENILEEALQMPTLDINGLAFADEATVAQAQAEYANKMAEFVKGGVMKEIEPFVQQAKAGLYEKEKAETLSSLSQVPELQGIGDMLPQLERIISNNKWLQSDDMPIDEKLINAYAIARGVNAINTPPEQPKELSAEELLGLYNSNPEFRELVEKQRVSEIKKSQQVPSFSASSGAGNAALNIPDRPKSFEEALERSRKNLF